MEKHHRTMEWHYDITMEHIMMSEVIITPHKQHRIIQSSWMQSYTLILKDKYSNKYIFISYTLAGNDIKSLNSRISKQNNLRLEICMAISLRLGWWWISFTLWARLSDITTQVTRLRQFCYSIVLLYFVKRYFQMIHFASNQAYLWYCNYIYNTYIYI